MSHSVWSQEPVYRVLQCGSIECVERMSGSRSAPMSRERCIRMVSGFSERKRYSHKTYACILALMTVLFAYFPLVRMALFISPKHALAKIVSYRNGFRRGRTYRLHYVNGKFKDTFFSLTIGYKKVGFRPLGISIPVTHSGFSSSVVMYGHVSRRKLFIQFVLFSFVVVVLGALALLFWRRHKAEQEGWVQYTE